MATNVSKAAGFYDYNPNTVPGLVARFRPEELPASGAVATWTANVGTNATQATGASQPVISANLLNGYKGVYFDGSNDWLTTGIQNSAIYSTSSVIAVVRTPSVHTGNNGRMLCVASGSGVSYAINGPLADGKMRGLNASVAWMDPSSSALGVDTAFMLEYVWNDAANTMTYHQDGNAQGTATYTTAPTATNTALMQMCKESAATYYGNLTIYEMMVFNTTLIEANRVALEGFLADKFGRKGALPSTHWHKNIKPLSKMLFWGSEAFASAA